MSYVIATPEGLHTAASGLSGIGSAIGAANAAAAARTTTILAAGTDEVSAAIAALFGEYAQAYQALSAQLACFHEQFVATMNTAASSYATVEAAVARFLDDVAEFVDDIDGLFGDPDGGRGDAPVPPGHGGDGGEGHPPGAGGHLPGDGGDGGAGG